MSVINYYIYIKYPLTVIIIIIIGKCLLTEIHATEDILVKFGLRAYSEISMFILHNESHPPPAILLDDAVEHTGKVDLRWQQLEVVGKPNTIT